MKKISSCFLPIYIILLVSELFILCVAKNTSIGCVAAERKALLKFKSSLDDPSNITLPSWRGIDCCTWEGITCDETTGYVIELRLSNMLSAESVDPSLLGLKYLNYLDLSGNDFGSRIPEFLGSLKQLHYLNLSESGFEGTVPRHLGNLSNLHTLDLSGNDGLSSIDNSWLCNLSSLERLDLSQVDLGTNRNFVKVLDMLPSLSILRLSGCSMNNISLPNSCMNSTFLSHVQYLDLSRNYIYGETPCFLQNMSSLRFLDLSWNHYHSSPIHFVRLRNLVDLNLARNNLGHASVWISKFMSGKCHLESLNLENNYFYGEISGAFSNISGCSSQNLRNLNLAINKLSGQIPESLGNLSRLRDLNMVLNKLVGPIPSSFENLKSLRVLILSGNQLSGEIPISLGQLSNLETLVISNNSFNGTISEVHFDKLSKLKELYVSSNLIDFKFGQDWVPSFQLKYLDMGSSNIGGQIPPWIQSQKALTQLDLSNCSISGTLPQWLGNMNLTSLDLSKNHIYGTIPMLSSSLRSLDLSDNIIIHLPSNIDHRLPSLNILLLGRNSINGSLPESLCNMRYLIVLELSRNGFSGNVADCWQNSSLGILDLSSNELSGIIPKSIGVGGSLSWLRLSNNSFTGQIPSTLQNCTGLQGLDVGENMLSGKIPEWIGNNLLDLTILRLRNNQFQGVIPHALCHASRLQILDIGNNNLTGYIPHCVGNFSGMIHVQILDYPFRDVIHQVLKGLEMEYYINGLSAVVNFDLSCNNLVGQIPSELMGLRSLRGLNLSHNSLGREIPSNIGDFTFLESLDLSNNNLVGRIPSNLSNLYFLSRLNLSNNNLSGPIPTGNQLQTLNDPSIYDGNPQLCGAPLLKACPGAETPKDSKSENDAADDGDSVDKIWFSAFVVGGFGTGFWGFVGLLVFKRSFRQAYFRFTEEMGSKILLAAAFFVRRF
ncbi:receptor-like protein EIX2 [Andrographis paniculata]|uniref:receptor-like protein EIX2 n=1 Tax=Andrographis paniculata TaxID=175694 RepID=UPI0021E88A62|nr:receptor-like protein EIX2 [Andrographis paniculata]